MAKHRRWTQDEIDLLGTAPDSEIARQTGRDRKAVTAKRLRLGIAPTQPQGTWTDDEIALLGTNYDRVIAKRLGRKLSAVTMHRQKLGIPAYNQKRQRRTRGDAYLAELPEALTLSPRRFRQTLNRIWLERHGEKLTTRSLATLSMWGGDQIKSWFCGTEEMPAATRHHLFICVALLDPL